MTDRWDRALDDLLSGRVGEAPLGGSPLEPGQAGENPQANQPDLDAGEPVQIAVLLGPFHRPEWMAWALHQLGVSGRCVKAGRLSLAVLDDPDEAAWHKAAADLSAALVFSDVVALRRGPSQDPAASDIQAFGYSDGQQTTALPPGLLLAKLPEPVEDVLLDPLGSADLLKRAVAAGPEAWRPGKRGLQDWWRPEVPRQDGVEVEDDGASACPHQESELDPGTAEE